MSTVERWPGKPTSGRYVYKCRWGWYWQCDLHDEEQPSGPNMPTWREAMDGALIHAAECPETNGEIER